jgi:hypothetical protein
MMTWPISASRSSTFRRRPAASTPTGWARGLPPDDQHRPGLAAAEYLMELLQYSPPDILSMSWYERVRPYAAGKVAMAYGYTLLAPYFELDETSPPHGTPATCRIRHGPGGAPGRAGGRLRDGHSANLAPGTHEATWSRRCRLHLAGRAEALRPERQPHRRRATRSAPTRKCARCRRSSRPSTRCPGATSCSSGRARQSRDLRDHPDLRRTSCTTCCAVS